MTISLRLLTTADVDDLYPRLRMEDAEECIVLGSNPREALLMGAFDNVFAVSSGRAYALISEENGLIGAVGFTSTGYLWALSTKFKTGDLRELYRRTREITVRLLNEAKSNGALLAQPFFMNLIHSRNKVAMRWLQRCGCFNVGTENEVAADGEVFYPFASKPLSEIAALHV